MTTTILYSSTLGRQRRELNNPSKLLNLTETVINMSDDPMADFLAREKAALGEWRCPRVQDEPYWYRSRRGYSFDGVADRYIR